MKKTKKWVLSLLITAIAILLVLGGFVIYIDPYFHFHGPLKNREYILNNERYQNDGILKNFEYDALIVGSSMTENFKTSEFDEIFGVTSVKTPYSGGSFKEVNDLLNVATSNNPDLKIVIRGLDYYRLIEDKDHIDYEDSDYPTYLYDDNPFNDVKYIYNMTVLLQALQNVAGRDADGPIVTSFDNYANWTRYYPSGIDIVNDHYARDTLTYAGSQSPMTEEDYEIVRGTIEQNVTSTAKAYPDVEFYIFFTPYSIYYMDYFYQNGDMQRQLAAEKYAIELMLECDNIHIYSFFTQYDTIWNLNEYRDVGHYSEKVNTQILYWMKDRVGLLTKDNYEAYCEEEYNYYMNLDYDAMYAELSGRDDVILNH